jgi:hypothetical protein
MRAPTAIKQGSGPDLGVKSEADNLVEATSPHCMSSSPSPAQERLWSHVSQVMRDNEKAMDALDKAGSKHATTKTAVDEVKSYAEIAEVHAAGLQKFVPVFEALYASMPDAQKQNADTVFRDRHHMRAKRH